MLQCVFRTHGTGTWKNHFSARPVLPTRCRHQFGTISVPFGPAVNYSVELLTSRRWYAPDLDPESHSVRSHRRFFAGDQVWDQELFTSRGMQIYEILYGFEIYSLLWSLVPGVELSGRVSLLLDGL